MALLLSRSMLFLGVVSSSVGFPWWTIPRMRCFRSVLSKPQRAVLLGCDSHLDCIWAFCTAAIQSPPHLQDRDALGRHVICPASQNVMQRDSWVDGTSPDGERPCSVDGEDFEWLPHGTKICLPGRQIHTYPAQIQPLTHCLLSSAFDHGQSYP